MGLKEKVVGFLEQVEENLYEFGEKFAQNRIDIMLSTLKLIGIRESLPKEEADYALADLYTLEGDYARVHHRRTFGKN